MLLEQVWGYHYKADTRLVNVHVQRLRAKVEHDPDNPRIVMTVRGVGYRAGAVTLGVPHAALRLAGGARPAAPALARLAAAAHGRDHARAVGDRGHGHRRLHLDERAHQPVRVAPRPGRRARRAAPPPARRRCSRRRRSPASRRTWRACSTRAADAIRDIGVDGAAGRDPARARARRVRHRSSTRRATSFDADDGSSAELRDRRARQRRQTRCRGSRSRSPTPTASRRRPGDHHRLAAQRAGAGLPAVPGLRPRATCSRPSTSCSRPWCSAGSRWCC